MLLSHDSTLLKVTTQNIQVFKPLQFRIPAAWAGLDMSRWDPAESLADSCLDTGLGLSTDVSVDCYSV